MTEREWDLTVHEIGPRLFRYFQYKGAKDSASDLTQESFVRLVKAHSKFDPATGPLVAFALGIAKNVWLESQRKQNVHVNLEDHQELSDETDLHSELERLDQAEKLKCIVRRLPQLQQDILFFYFDEELTTRRIAEILDIPEGTIKSHLHRSKEFIKKILDKEPL